MKVQMVEPGSSHRVSWAYPGEVQDGELFFMVQSVARVNPLTDWLKQKIKQQQQNRTNLCLQVDLDPEEQTPREFTLGILHSFPLELRFLESIFLHCCNYHIFITLTFNMEDCQMD